MSQKSGLDLINEAKAKIREVTAAESVGSTDSVFLDVREPNEYALGHIPGAVFIPRGVLETTIEAAIPRDRKIVIYCASGNRSAFAADTLHQMGYSDVASMAGGFRGWVQAGGEVES